MPKGQYVRVPTQEQLDMIDQINSFISEGMPSTWIAETLGIDKSTIFYYARHKKENVLEWRRVWTYIRRSPELLKLHREFAPTNSPSDITQISYMPIYP